MEIKYTSKILVNHILATLNIFLLHCTLCITSKFKCLLPSKCIPLFAQTQKAASIFLCKISFLWNYSFSLNCSFSLLQVLSWRVRGSHSSSHHFSMLRKIFALRWVRVSKCTATFICGEFLLPLSHWVYSLTMLVNKTDLY